MTPTEVTIILPDGGVATINLEDTANIFTEYYQNRLDRLAQPTPAPIVLTEEDWEELGAGKCYRKEWEGCTTLGIEMIKDAVNWLVLGSSSEFPKINARPLLPLIEIDIRWEDGEEVEGLLVSQYDDIDEDNDDAMFYYGLTWAEVQDCIKNKTGPLGSEFTIVAARLVEP